MGKENEGWGFHLDAREQKYLAALYSIPGMGQRTVKLLVDYFQSPEYAWQGKKHWQNVPGLAENRLEAVLEHSREVDLERVWDTFDRSQAQIVTLNDPGYPHLLKNIFDPPFLLYLRGELPRESDICIGMVGARRASAYGRQMAQELAQGLAQHGVWVISGMARGIDTYSHLGSIRNKGKTVAVLGSGIDVVYPRENKDLFRQICASGGVISELPLGAQPLAQHFPARNRIISGLSQGVVVVEAAEKSGALITVDFALEQGRDVFAVPGPVTSPLSRGTHRLIRQGAKLVEKAEDILEEYREVSPEPDQEYDLFSFSHEERQILEKMMGPGIHFDALIAQLGLDPAKLAALLTLWEIKGLVKQLPGKYYTIGKIGQK